MSALAALAAVALVAAGLGRAALPSCARALQLCVGLVLSLGVWSASYGAVLLAAGSTSTLAVAKDVALALAGAALIWGGRSSPKQPARSTGGADFRWWLLALSAAAAALALVAATRAAPDGDWDATLFWNLRARFFVRDAAPLSHAFDARLYHLDYPLLLPGLVAQLWTLTREASLVPTAVGALFAALCVAVLVLTLRELRGAASAALAGSLLCATPLFALTAAAQYADVPLACLQVAAVALCALGLERKEAGAFIGAGLAAGLAAWTKNEGALHLAALLAALMAAGKGRARRLLLFASGALGPLLLVLAFKAAPFVPAGDLFTGGVAASLERAGDSQRWLFVLASLALRFIRVGDWGLSWPLLLLAFAAARARGPLLPAPALVLGSGALFVAGALAVYASTPHPIGWHVASSLDRLLLQAWPSLLLGAALAQPGDTLSSERAAASAAAFSTGA